MFRSISLHASWVTTNIVGGLGNQLFLIANLIATAKRNNLQAFATTLSESSSCGPPRPTYWNTLFAHLPETFNVKLFSETEANVLRKQCHVQLIAEPRPVTPIVLSDKTNSLHAQSFPSNLYELIGFYQSNQFFSDYSTLIHDHIVPENICAIAKQILMKNYCRVDNDQSINCNVCASNWDGVHLVGIHVRRGDYVEMKDTFEELSLNEYYDSALRLLLGRQLRCTTNCSEPEQTRKGDEEFNKISNKSDMSDAMRRMKAYNRDDMHKHHHQVTKNKIHGLIFCDDAHYGTMMANYFHCKYSCLEIFYVHEINEKQSTHVNMSMLPHSTEVQLPREVVELVMLSMCHDIIMANSSFSWWASFLNSEPLRRIIAPIRWFVQQPYPQSNHLYCSD